MEQRMCVGCGTQFIRTVQAAQRYCTPACRTRTIDQRKKARHERTCAWCTKPFNCLPHAKQRTCSLTCGAALLRQGDTSPLPWRQCVTCERVFYSRKHWRTCSAPCRYEAGADARRRGWAKNNAKRAARVPTRTYKCKRCGKTYTRRGNVEPSYCTPKCAKAERKRQYKHLRRAKGGERFTTRSIAERDGWRCHICGKKVPDVEWTGQPTDPTLDHLIPVSAGGQHTPSNVALSHFRCNTLRSDTGSAQLRLIA